MTEQEALIIAGIVRGVIQQEVETIVEQVVERQLWVAGEILAKLGTPVVTAIAEIEKSVGLLIDGQVFVEKLVASMQHRVEEGDEWKHGKGPDDDDDLRRRHRR